MTTDDLPHPVLVEGRECGPCVACCKIPEINVPELRKPANVMCPNCTGTGCGIYPNRPPVCRAWYCMWRRLAALPDGLRPDKVGVMFWLDRREPAASPFEKVFIVGQAVDDPAAFSNSLVKAAIDAFIRHAGLPIWLAFGAERKLIHPDGAFQDAILNPTTTPWQSLVPAALAWRKNYGLD